MPPACAIASISSTPGTIGWPGKWPWKNSSLIVKFLIATIRCFELDLEHAVDQQHRIAVRQDRLDPADVPVDVRRRQDSPLLSRWPGPRARSSRRSTAPELGQPPQQRLLAPPVGDRHRRDAGDGRPRGRLRRRPPTSKRPARRRRSRRCPATPAWPASTTPSPELGAAGDPRLPAENGAAADLDIVSDLHQIVDLGAVSDPGRAEQRAVDRGEGADLDVGARSRRRPPAGSCAARRASLA